MNYLMIIRKYKNDQDKLFEVFTFENYDLDEIKHELKVYVTKEAIINPDYKITGFIVPVIEFYEK